MYRVPCWRIQVVVFGKNGNDFALVHPLEGAFDVSDKNSSRAEDGRDPIASLRDDLTSGLTDPIPSKAITNIQLLASIGDWQTVSVLKGELAAFGMEERGWAYISLLKLKNYSELTKIKTYLEITPIEPGVRFVQALLAGALGSMRDPLAAEALENIAESSSSLARSGAVSALRYIAVPRSVPILVRKLDDPNQDVRYDAVMGLATIEHKGEGWSNDFENYRKSESAYLKLWKTWWATIGKDEAR